MKLLFDENLSPILAARLAQMFPGSTHVSNVGLRGADDQQIWEYARSEAYAIVSKDTDFRELSKGAPPKVVWLNVGNAGTESIDELLRRELDRVERFLTEEESSLLILSLEPQSI
ncbi:MAG TPA: DUF5615 family PIN-like protein [Terriglobia bacterium]|nr:DUF5615 family PIN-like protein [Terriglobia bacterium]